MTSKQKETYQKWKDNVNMSKSELQRFYDSEEGKEAGLSKSEASKQGIDYGRESARWIFKMKDIPVSEWSPTMWKWAGKQNSFISRMSGVQGKLYDSKGRKTRKHLALLIWGHNPEKKSKGGELRVKEREYDKLREQSGIVTNIDPEGLLDSGVESAPIFKRGGTLAQTPAPKKDRIYGSKINKQKSAESKQSAKDIKFSEETIKALQNKVKEYNESHSAKVSLATLKAIYRRGAGAYSSSHRPTITGGKPNTRNAWAMARVNKFLLKKSGEPVKKAYVQDDDLLKKGGQTNTLLAPNGKPSNLTPEQWHLVRTPEFKAWFGDWENEPENASKVADENGEPLVVYHGSDSEFYEFDINKQVKGWRGKGFYFTSNKSEALDYGSSIYEVFLNLRNPFNVKGDKIKKDGSVEFAKDFILQVTDAYNTYVDTKIVKEILIENKKDGIEEGNWYVAYYPNQIKLADGTNTTFDAENTDIRYDEGGVSDFSKVASASSRFRPVETIVFNPPLVGTNGAKLISYTWKYEMTMQPNWEGELVGKRISDWSQAENSADTGRDIVHVYNVQMPDGTIKSVSSESVPILLGFVNREQAKVFGSLATASKTLAKNQMKLAIMEAQAKEYEDLLKKFEKEPKPPIEIASRSELPYISGKIFDREIAEKGYSNMIFYKMGDAIVSTDNIYIKSKEEYEKFIKLPPSRYIVEQLTSNWISNQLSKAGAKTPYGLYDLRNRVERQKRRVENMLKGEKLEQGGETETKIALPDTYASEESLKRVLDQQGYELSKKVNQSDMEKTILTISEVAEKHSVPVETLSDELIEGIKTEMEHTNNPEEAKKIALDHLAENPQYYQYLQKMEVKMKQETIDKHYDELTTKYSNGGEISAMYSFRTPTGEPTRLSYIQQVLVRTSQFKNWFGDWEKAGKLFEIERQKMSIPNATYMSFNEIYTGVSNVIDMVTLEPKVVYHGTGAGEEFYQFDVSRESGVGRPYAYFADNIEYSQNFVLRRQGFLYECFLNIKNPFMAINNLFYAKRETYPYWLDKIAVELSFNKQIPLINIRKEVKDSLEPYFKSVWINETGERPFWMAMSADKDSIFKRYLMLNNFDGIRYAEEFTNNYDIDNPAEFTRAWCIFDAKQVKLADGRNIDFSPFEADIRLADGGNLEPKVEIIDPMVNDRIQNMRKQMGLDAAPETQKFGDGGSVYGDGENTKNAKDGGYFKGKSHANGGIKAINIDTGQIIEVEGNEVIINKRSVADPTKREFEGKMLTNKEILSKINEMGGGVKFEKGGNLHDSCGCSGKKYKFWGETLEDYVILSRINKLSESYLTPEEESINQLNNMLSEIYG